MKFGWVYQKLSLFLLFNIFSIVNLLLNMNFTMNSKHDKWSNERNLYNNFVWESPI